MPKQDLALKPTTMVAPAPSFVDTDASLGNENVGSNDLLLPYLKLLQAMSPEVQEGPNNVEGARPGLILNTLTHETFEELLVVPVHFSTEFSVFAKRGAPVQGPAKFGSYGSEVDAAEALIAAGKDSNQYDIIQSGRNIIYVLDESGQIQTEALMYMDGSKLRVNREWNSLIRQTERPRFSGVWKLSTRRQSNAQGSWFNYDVKWFGWVPSEDVYNRAKALVEAIQEGTVNVSADDGTA